MIACCVRTNNANNYNCWVPATIGDKIKINSQNVFGRLSDVILNENSNKYILKVVTKKGLQKVSNYDCFIVDYEFAKLNKDECITHDKCLKERNDRIGQSDGHSAATYISKRKKLCQLIDNPQKNHHQIAQIGQQILDSASDSEDEDSDIDSNNQVGRPKVWKNGIATEASQ